MKYKLFALAVYCAALVLAAAPKVYGKDKTFIPTARGTFHSCEDAVAFRDGELFRKFEAFANAYDSEKEQRIKEALADFKQYRAAAVKAILVSGKKQREIVYIAARKYLAAKMISLATGSVLKKLPSGVPEADKKILKSVLDASNGLKLNAAEALATGKADGKDIIAGRAKDLLVVIRKAANNGVAGPMLKIASEVYDVGSVSIPAAFDVLGQGLDKDVANAEIKIIEKSVARLMRASIADDLRIINSVRAKIDSHCNKSDDQADLDAFEKELSEMEVEVEADVKKRRAGGSRRPAMDDLLKRAKRNYDARAGRLKDRSRRNRDAAAAAAIQRGMSAFDRPSQQGCSKNITGRAPRHCCQMVRQQIAETRRVLAASSNRQHRKVINSGIEEDQQWYNAHCR